MSESAAPPAGPCLQEEHAPQSTCFGCGPANDRGLRIRSFASSGADPASASASASADPSSATSSAADETIAEWQPQAHHEAFPGMLSGGIIGTLLDCHSNWTAAWHLMRRAGAAHPPCTVTADYAVKLLRPTPSRSPVRLSARVVSSTDDRAEVEATLVSLENGKTCATCRGTFVAVKPGHPAYHRW